MNRLLAVCLLASFALHFFGDSARAEDRSELLAVFFGQIVPCYMIPKEAHGTEPVVVKVTLKPDGALADRPEIIRGSPDSLNAKAALRALYRCSPFKVPMEWTSRYREWKVLHIQFDAHW